MRQFAHAPKSPSPSPSAAILRRKCACGGSEHDCEDCKEEGKLQRKATGWRGPEVAPPIVHEVLSSPGEPLDTATARLMGEGFNHDFSHVRIHSDARAAQSADAVEAHAYTVGSDLVFARGQYATGTPSGRELLAHELAHVVQEGSPWSRSGSIRVSDPADAAEHAADVAASHVAAGERPALARAGDHHDAALRRKVLNAPVADFQPGAQACMVHVHGEEKTALAVGKELRTRRCLNLLHLDTTKRFIDFDFQVAGLTFVGQADPNRIFTPAGRAGPDSILETHPQPGQKAAGRADPKAVRRAAEQVLEAFADQVFVPKLDECRKPPKDESGSLPVLALHNNEGLSPAKFKPVASADRAPNPARGDRRNPNDFFFVTRAADFDELKGSHNVLLQENPIQPKNDDGSLSVLLAGTRYINVEKEGRRHDRPVGPKSGIQTQDDVYLKNYSMAAEALDLFGVSPWPCLPSPAGERATRSQFNRRLGQSGRKTTAMAQDKPVLDPDPELELFTKGCRTFKNQPDLDTRVDEWRVRIERIPLRNLVHWVLGGPRFTPPEAVAEFKAQQKCLIESMRRSLTAKGLALPKGDVLLSGRRTSGGQQGIWSSKFSFTTPKRFDRISDFARAKCDPLLGSDTQWNPKSKDHIACWKQLTDDEKQKEILMASSPPGISRHHTGMDFDFGQKEADLVPMAWTGTGRFADAYRWLARNASAFGFIQPFDTKGGYGKGYMSERWHWSYYPVAQAALEFVMDHDTEVEAELLKLWSDPKGGIKPQFSFVAKSWRDYLFNVEDTGVF